MRTEGPRIEAAEYVAVAVPVPLLEPLTYRVPQPWRALVRVGVRVRVPVGRRRLVGWVVGLPPAPPAGLEEGLRSIESVMDFERLLPDDLMKLADFTAAYYAAPIGEVLKTLLPGTLPASGDRRLELTNRGALAEWRDPKDRALQQFLLERGRVALTEVWDELGNPDLPGRIDRWREGGQLRVHESGGRSARYRQAVELPRGDRKSQLERCGRSTAGRAVVEYLAALGRPATIREVRAGVGCSAGVVRRLVTLGVLRSFTQIEPIDLARHRLPGNVATEPFELRPDQAAAARELVRQVRSGHFRPSFLGGMTGSGKTEVYLRGAAAALREDRSVIILVPEIALVPALARALRERFQDRVAMLHSNLGSAERRQEWERIHTGEARVVVGPRSAVFAPARNLGLIVVDEEQDGAYKQDTRPRYSGRDLALVRARTSAATALLVSATPSLETRLNVERGRYRELRLTARVGVGALPEAILVDLRKEPGNRPRRPGDVAFSGLLVHEIGSSLKRGEQVILLRNRRGYSPQLLCRACGENMPCEDCGLPKSYHRRERRLVCHYCGGHAPVPRVCPGCGEDALQPIGAGTERVEEEVRKRFPAATVDVLDRDTTRRVGGAAAVLERFRSGRTDILIGTQMISKGHHFPNVALAAVLTADSYLGFPDFRASERSYALLTQLAGRAGRGDRAGRFVIQTYHPDHYAIQAVLNQDDEAFASHEMRFRRTFHYPPFTRMVQLVVRDRNRDRGRSRIEELAAAARRHELAAGVRFSGPAPAPLERLKGRWRFQFLMRSARGTDVRSLARAVVPAPAADLTVDIDPQDLM
ncbi:MAG: primosomal protein N' [Acidobacteriota bacterium]|nr:primosomal protein N' [Acidobacteriota bacterium]MDE3265226.1 primosomal protein N' [Acidobacteriota bacterium]